jgi:hypothetical protein
LCGLDDPESVFLARHLDIDWIIASDLQEHSGIWATFVGLPSRMKESRSEAEAGGDALVVADQHTDFLEHITVTRVAFDVGQQRAIVAFSDSPEIIRETLHQRGGLYNRLALRLASEPDAPQDQAVAEIERAGHPVVRIAVTDRYHIGQEFFRWELATAVAGSILGINPFDQPDVEASKVRTRELTTAYELSGRLPPETALFEEGGLTVFADEKNRSCP